MARQLRDDSGSGGGRRGPDEEHCRGSLECRVERRRVGEVPRHDLDTGGQSYLARLAREGAHRGARAQKLVDDEATGAACRASHESYVVA